MTKSNFCRVGEALLETSNKFNVPNELESIEAVVANLKDSDIEAKLLSVELDSVTVDDPDGFYDVFKKANLFKDKNQLSLAMSYKFEVPKMGVIEDNFGTPPGFGGKKVIIRKGQRYEVDDYEDIIGPLDTFDNPIKGHPDFVEEWVDNEDDIAPIPEKSGTKRHTSQIQEAVKGFSKQSLPPEEPSRPLETVYLELDSFGTVMYEPSCIVKTKQSIVLVFDPLRSKPSFIPKVGVKRFSLTWDNKELSVVYMGTTFSYGGKTFLCFTELQED